MAGADPTGGGIGQAASELLKEMQKAQADMQQTDAKRQSGLSEGFAQAMQQANQSHSANQNQSQAAQAGRVVADGSVDQIKREERVRDKLATTKVGATERGDESKLSRMLENLINGQDKMTKIMHTALSGKQFSPTELIAMQAGVYRFSQELDLTSKVVEKATAGIKQTLNTQV